MYALGTVGNVSSAFNASVSVLGVKFSVNDVKNALCRVFNIPCDCDSLLRIPENAMQEYVINMMASLIGPILGGANCNSDLVGILANSLNFGVGSGGVTIDINTAALARDALCNIARLGVMQSRELLRPAATIVSALRSACVQTIQQSGGQVSTNNRYAVQQPVVNQPPQTQPPTTLPPNPYNTAVAPLPFTPVSSKKTKVSPLLVASGVAIVASSVILFVRR